MMKLSDIKSWFSKSNTSAQLLDMLYKCGLQTIWSLTAEVERLQAENAELRLKLDLASARPQNEYAVEAGDFTMPTKTAETGFRTHNYFGSNSTRGE